MSPESRFVPESVVVRIVEDAEVRGTSDSSGCSRHILTQSAWIVPIWAVSSLASKLSESGSDSLAYPRMRSSVLGGLLTEKVTATTWRGDRPSSER